MKYNKQTNNKQRHAGLFITTLFRLAVYTEVSRSRNRNNKHNNRLNVTFDSIAAGLLDWSSIGRSGKM